MQSTLITLSAIIRRHNPSLSPRDALDAGRFLLAAPAADVARYRAEGYTRNAAKLRVMAYLAR